MIEPVAVAVHAIGRFGPVKGLNVLVMGAGPIGNLVAQTAKALGAAKTMITDLSEYRLELAKKCGVDAAVNTGIDDISTAIGSVFGPDKADVIFECVGVNDTIDKAIANARKGTDIVVVGVFGDKPKVDLGLVQDRELRLIGTLMYQEKDFLTAIELAAAKKIMLKPLITNHFKFEDYKKAYEFIEEKKDKAMKVIVDF
jgi:L-iditol 2-dehydrogenase